MFKQAGEERKAEGDYLLCLSIVCNILLKQFIRKCDRKELLTVDPEQA